MVLAPSMQVSDSRLSLEPRGKYHRKSKISMVRKMTYILQKFSKEEKNFSFSRWTGGEAGMLTQVMIPDKSHPLYFALYLAPPSTVSDQNVQTLKYFEHVQILMVLFNFNEKSSKTPNCADSSN